MNVIHAQEAMQRYAQAYERLYNRAPRDLRALDQEWVIVNGARMRAAELEHLTHQLQLEYSQSLVQKRSMVNRILKWLRSN
jgi:hypothetical protein